MEDACEGGEHHPRDEVPRVSSVSEIPDPKHSLPSIYIRFCRPASSCQCHPWLASFIFETLYPCKADWVKTSSWNSYS